MRLEVPEREPEIVGCCAACGEAIYENEMVWRDGDCLIHADHRVDPETNELCLKAWIEQECLFEELAQTKFTKENAAL